MASNKSFIFAVVSGLLMSTATPYSTAKSNEHELFALVGTNWACNYTEVVTGFESAGNVAFSGGGIGGVEGAGIGDGGVYICDMDINNQRPLPGFPVGAHVTVLTGTWKKVDACHFSIVASAVILALQPDPVDPTISTWQPFARIKDVGKMKLKGNILTGTRTISFYDYFDISLTQPKINPATGLPIPNLVQKAKAQIVTK